MIEGLYLQSAWQTKDHEVGNAPEGLRVRIVMRRSRWHAEVWDRATGEIVFEQRVPTLDNGIWVLRNYLRPTTNAA